MTSKIIEWLIGKPKPHNTPPYVSAFKTDAGVADKSEPETAERGRYAESKKDREESAKALIDWRARADDSVKKYKPKGGEYRIRQEPAGHFVIERRNILRAYSPSYNDYGGTLMGPPLHRRADEIASWPTTPRETYETVKNTDAPIMVKRHDYFRYRGYYPSESYSLEGYQDLAFNVFADAEAYLKRMAKPADYITEYDFPPLKKRVAKKPAVKVVSTKLGVVK